MRIASVHTQIVGSGWKNWVLVAVETDEGAIGWGEATMGYTALPAEGAVLELAPALVGLDPTEPRRVRDAAISHWERLDDAVHQTAISAIEIACWDLRGKRMDVPLWRLLGDSDGAQTPVYANGWYRGDREPDALGALAAAAIQAGYRSLKLDPFGTAKGSISPAELALAVKIVSTVRERVGPAIQLMVDAHDRFDVRTAIAVAEALAPVGLAFLEAPCDSTDFDALAIVAAASPIPLAVGERFVDLEAFRRLALDTPIRIWQPESLTLGVAALGRLDQLATEHDATVIPHNARGPVSQTLNVHACAAFPRFQALEWFVEDAMPLARDIAPGLPRMVDGLVGPPPAAGLGIEIDRAEAAKHPFDPTHRLDFGRVGWEHRIPTQGLPA